MDETIDTTEVKEQAAHKAKSAAMAIEISREVHQQQMVQQTKEALLEALQETFKREHEGDSNVLIRRVPLICQDIVQIRKDIADSRSDTSDIKDDIKWVTRLILGTFITAAIGAVFLIIK